MAQNNFSPSSHPSSQNIDNIIPLRQKILPHHRLALFQWSETSTIMGILDVDIAPLSCHTTLTNGPEQVIIWRRESAQPAYIIRPVGRYWQLIDAREGVEIGRFVQFNTVLETICPASCIADRQQALR